MHKRPAALVGYRRSPRRRRRGITTTRRPWGVCFHRHGPWKATQRLCQGVFPGALRRLKKPKPQLNYESQGRFVGGWLGLLFPHREASPPPLTFAEQTPRWPSTLALDPGQDDRVCERPSFICNPQIDSFTDRSFPLPFHSKPIHRHTPHDHAAAAVVGGVGAAGARLARLLPAAQAQRWQRQR